MKNGGMGVPKTEQQKVNQMKRILYILTLFMSIIACTEEIDKSNRYTFTGETVADFLRNRSDKYSHMITLLERAGLFGLLSTYGQYTLFLPDNDAVENTCKSKIASTTHQRIATTPSGRE